MIELKNVSRTYGENCVLSDLSFSFPDKGVFCLSGASGCGKTTLLRLLAGLDLPSSGSVISTHRKVSVSFQEPRLFPWLNSIDNINIVLSKDNKSLDIAKKWLQLLELTEAENLFPDALSGGMQQRLSLARALAFGGDLVLLDEPFSALDTDTKKRIAPHVKEACKDALLILVTHDEEDAALLGGTPLVLENGKLKAPFKNS